MVCIIVGVVTDRGDELGNEPEAVDSPTQPFSAVVDDLSVASRPAGAAATFTRNSLLSVGRLFLTTAVALVLPAYLTHHLPVKTYSAWVLILQMSGYVGYLDFGVQTGIAKYVAEFDARGDYEGASKRANAGFFLMVCTSFAGILLTLVLAWKVPELFREMPTSLYGTVRISLLLVGVSLSIGMLCSICSAVFMGLQRYGVPMVLSLANRVLFTGAIFLAVFWRSSLAVMGAMVALVNLVTGGLQFVAWWKIAPKVRLSLLGVDRTLVKKMLQYCSALAVWTVGMLCVTGLDITIVGRYDFAQTAFYAVAASPTNFMVSILGAALAPLMPTASAESVYRGPAGMGDLLSRTTRYSTILLLLSGVPLLVGGYYLLSWWVGPVYATKAIPYMRILVLANMVRNLCLPYAGMLVATESQKVAIAGATAEAVVNLGSSVYLARHIGAIGVAYGTLLGAFVSVGMHFALSMHYTYPKFSISRVRLFFAGMVRPAVLALPTIVSVPLWWSATAPRFNGLLWALWLLSTLMLAWFGALSGEERERLIRVLGGYSRTLQTSAIRGIQRR